VVCTKAGGGADGLAVEVTVLLAVVLALAVTLLVLDTLGVCVDKGRRVTEWGKETW
jgi:hypothetical protein